MDSRPTGVRGYHRRAFLKAVSVGGAAGIVGRSSRLLAAEPPPETRRIRIADISAVGCFAPQVVAKDLLLGEGFAEVQYVGGHKPSSSMLLAAGDVDISLGLAPALLLSIDAGEPVVVIAGAHAGCYELFTARGARAIKDLKGKEIVVARKGNGAHVFLSMMLAYVGVDPRQDVSWKEEPRWPEVVRLLTERKVDAFLGFPPEPQELRGKGIGRVILNTTTDRPWSQYFCCAVGANREFVRRNPIATRRALRAILKAADLCSADPQRAARIVAPNLPRIPPLYVDQMMKELPYGSWRNLSAEDSLRFYALRLYEIGMVKLDPQKLLAQATDWRFIDALGRELKA